MHNVIFRRAATAGIAAAATGARRMVRRVAMIYNYMPVLAFLPSRITPGPVLFRLSPIRRNQSRRRGDGGRHDTSVALSHFRRVSPDGAVFMNRVQLVGHSEVEIC